MGKLPVSQQPARHAIVVPQHPGSLSPLIHKIPFHVVVDGYNYYVGSRAAIPALNLTG